MDLTVQAFNADATFLLKFSERLSRSGTATRSLIHFSILLDPWLVGPSSVFHPGFQLSNHTGEPLVRSLADLDHQPDLIVISQDKPDHCHRATLCSIPQTWKNTRILAVPTAAKKIRSWKHFAVEHIHELPVYQPRKEDRLVQIPVRKGQSNGVQGEFTVANIVTKGDLTGLHNAISITYQAIEGHTKFPEPKSDDGPNSAPPNDDGVSSGANWPPLPAGRQPLSILYTPHGVSASVLQPCIRHLLEPLGALPVTAVFHGATVEENPWFMGGMVANGVPGGLEIVTCTRARHWIGAHDEVKENKGMATVWMRSKRYRDEEVQDLLDQAGLDSKFHSLETGEAFTIN